MQQLTKEQMRKALSEMPTGFEDEDTVIQVEESFTSATPAAPSEPPALPFTLMRKKSDEDDAWLEDLSPAARAVLERAMMPAPSWPFAPRLPGAVATPSQKIPKLERRSEA